MLKKMWTVSAATAILLCGMTLGLASVANAAVPVLTEKNQKLQVTPSQNQFSVQLKANHSTGFSWVWQNPDPRLTVISHTYVKPGRAAMGAGGYELWTFQVNQRAFQAKQQFNLTFVYQRPWNKKTVKTQSFFIAV